MMLQRNVKNKLRLCSLILVEVGTVASLYILEGAEYIFGGAEISTQIFSDFSFLLLPKPFTNNNNNEKHAYPLRLVDKKKKKTVYLSRGSCYKTMYRRSFIKKVQPIKVTYTAI